MSKRCIAAAIALVLPLATQTPRVLAQDNSGATESPVVTVVKAATTEIETRIAVSGTLVAAEEVLINTRTNGYAVESILVEVGDNVDAGSVLATLDDSSLKAQLAQAEAELLRTEAAIGQARSQIDATIATQNETASNLERNQRLRDSGNISESAIEQARSSANTAQANVASARDGLRVAQAQRTSAESQRDIARLTLERTQIKTPVAGMVSDRNAQLGEIASSGGEPMFRIIRNAELEIAVDVVETSLAGLDKGDKATLNVAGVGRVSGTVRLIEPTVDPDTRLGSVRLSLPVNPALKAGLSASGWIITDQYEAITVPASAVLTDGLKSHVQMVVNGLVKTQPVTAGALSSDGLREIIEGLQGGEQVIARAGAFFIDGDTVRVTADANTDETASDETATDQSATDDITTDGAQE